MKAMLVMATCGAVVIACSDDAASPISCDDSCPAGHCCTDPGTAPYCCSYSMTLTSGVHVCGWGTAATPPCAPYPQMECCPESSGQGRCIDVDVETCPLPP